MRGEPGCRSTVGTVKFTPAPAMSSSRCQVASHKLVRPSSEPTVSVSACNTGKKSLQKEHDVVGVLTGAAQSRVASHCAESQSMLMVADGCDDSNRGKRTNRVLCCSTSMRRLERCRGCRLCAWMSGSWKGGSRCGPL